MNKISYFLKCLVKDFEDIEKMRYIGFHTETNCITVIYKQSAKNVFYLIIYQETITMNLPYLILQECIKIIQKYKSIKTTIIPIVIFHQKDKYKNRKKERFFQITTYNNHILELKYNLVELQKMYNQPKMRETILADLVFLI